MKQPAFFRLSFIVLAAAVAALSVSSAPAQEADARTPTATPIYNQAVELMEKGKYDEACPMLEEVVRLVPEGIGAKVTLAECYEESGRLASAWRTYGVVEEAAAKAGQADRQKKAHARQQALEPKLARITIEVPEPLRPLSNLVITRDKESVERLLWGVPVPVDRGHHNVVAVAGQQRFEKEIDIPKDGVTISVVIGGISPAAASAAPLVGPPPPKADAAPTRPDAAPTKPDARFGAQRTAALIVMGAGLASVGVGSFFGVRALQKLSASNADGHCDAGDFCDAMGLGLRDEGLTAATVSTALFIAGGVALAGGATLFFTAPKGAPRAAADGARLMLGPGTIGFRAAF